VGIITSVLVLPIIPLTMALAFLAGLAASVLPVAVADILALPAKLLLDYIILVAKWGASLPLSSIEYQPSLSFVIIYYLVFTIGVIILWRTIKHNFRGDNVVE